MARKTTDIHLAKSPEDDVQRLSPLDLALMVASQARAELAAKNLQLVIMRRSLIEAQREAETLKMAERQRLLQAAVTQSIEAAKEDAEGKMTAHKEMTRGLAQKYKVDWASCAYNEETGVITSTP